MLVRDSQGYSTRVRVTATVPCGCLRCVLDKILQCTAGVEWNKLLSRDKNQFSPGVVLNMHVGKGYLIRLREQLRTVGM